MKVAAIYPGSKYYNEFIRFIESVKNCDIDIYYYNTDITELSKKFKSINFFNINKYTFNNIIKIMKAYNDLILCELDMIFMCDINKDIFNEYSFGVFDQNIHNKNIEIFNITDKNYRAVTNEIMYFTKPYKDYVINTILYNTDKFNFMRSKFKKILELENYKQNIQFRYETSKYEIATSFTTKYFEVTLINNERYIIDNGIKIKLF